MGNACRSPSARKVEMRCSFSLSILAANHSHMDPQALPRIISADLMVPGRTVVLLPSQVRDLLHLLRGQFERLQFTPIPLQPLAARASRQHDHALVNTPTQCYVGRSHSILSSSFVLARCVAQPIPCPSGPNRSVAAERPDSATFKHTFLDSFSCIASTGPGLALRIADRGQ